MNVAFRSFAPALGRADATLRAPQAVGAKLDAYRRFEVALNAPLCPGLLRDDAVVTSGGGWHRTLTPSSPWATDDNEILFSNLQGDDVDAVIDRLIAEYRSFGRPMRWCVYPWTQPEDLGARLEAQGATRSDIQALLCDAKVPLKPIEGAEVAAVEPKSRDYDDYIALMASGEASTGLTLPEDEVAFRRGRYAELIAGPNPTMRLYLGRHGGEPVACGAMYLKRDHAWFTGDYIKPAFRARGYFQSLLAARLQDLRGLGIPLAAGHGREATSVPLLLRTGWKPAFPYRIYRIEPSEDLA